jgi:L-asparaginase II
LPLDQSAALAWVRAGGGRERILQNCSGKHAAMVVTCLRNGWPLDDYRHPAHPLQRLVASTLEEFTGEKVAAVGVDGCGAPLFAASLVGLARAFCRLLTAPEGSPERSIADAMRRNPEVVGGTGRDVTRLMQGIPGLLAKDGAEGTYVAALADGAAVVVKVGDGADRARMPVMVTALRALGVDAPVLDELATVPVLGGGAPVGVVRSVEL